MPTDSDINFDIKEIVSRVQQIHIQAAESYLSEDDSLHQYIIDYYSDAERLESELSFFLTNKRRGE
ncbi:MAG: hypothetical protein K9M11_04870 [Candidatus Pacebacteria bacterium]|nr:hypothetical protein [Candidatus Paceibacterota bacterium]